MRQVNEAIEECAFEPESTEIRCVECEKPTGEMGTCRDVGFCAECRESYIAAGMAHGLSRTASETDFSEMLITMIEGRGYKAKYKTRRVLHLSVDGKPLCSVKGGPHPLTTNRDETNCKRCLAKAVVDGPHNQETK